MRRVQIEVSLSRLVPGKRNPRRVKPAREAHRRLVALIRAYGLLHPLVVRPADGKRYHVIAGNRRLLALKEIHRGDGDPKIPCLLRDVNAETADAMSLGENFGREAMHPLDEAEAFARLATGEGKDARAIAVEFGVSEHYVRQRMKLATLAGEVKVAYRNDVIDTGTAEAFSAVPEDRQLEVWKEVGGTPRHAEHVRNVIANGWIDAKLAQFDLSVLPASAVSRDLFSDQVLVERQAFMQAQAQALEVQRQALAEEGWKEVVVARREEIQDRLLSMDAPQREFDEQTTKQLEKIGAKRQKLEARTKEIGDEDADAWNALNEKLDALDAEEQQIIEQAPEHFSEATKSVATTFLILDPDGQVYPVYRVPRTRRQGSANGDGHPAETGVGGTATPPTSDELSDKQLAVTFTHQALGVREALLTNDAARRRVLALILHEKIRSEGLSIRHDANGTTLLASQGDGFSSVAFDRLQQKRLKLDPLSEKHHVEDREGYELLGKMTSGKLDALINLLIVDCITAHMQRRTELVQHLADELKVDIRQDWQPDAAWLASYQKIQLAHLMAELRGSIYSPAHETRKKSELVDVLAKLFTDAAEGKLDDKTLADRVNRWLPINLREGSEESPGVAE